LNLFQEYLNYPYLNLINQDLFFYNNSDNEKQIENSYESLKNVKYIYAGDSQNLNISKLNFNIPFSYATILDAFRVSYDESS
jgi:hypothetical protein